MASNTDLVTSLVSVTVNNRPSRKDYDYSSMFSGQIKIIASIQVNKLSKTKGKIRNGGKTTTNCLRMDAL